MVSFSNAVTGIGGDVLFLKRSCRKYITEVLVVCSYSSPIHGASHSVVDACRRSAAYPSLKPHALLTTTRPRVRVTCGVHDGAPTVSLIHAGRVPGLVYQAVGMYREYMISLCLFNRVPTFSLIKQLQELTGVD